MKRIITCSDGTWNEPNTSSNGKPVRTNVQKIFDLIERRDQNNTIQIKYYDEGVGAEGNIVTRMINGATGNGIDQNIIDAYKFIIWNYEPGDHIYLFGFSRGAYTARSLGGLIRKAGILKQNNLNLIKEAYRLYRKKEVGPETTEAKEFRSKNSFDVSHIKFIGVWDTVGSLGIPLSAWQWYNKSKYAFHDTRLSSIVEHAYHAVAIDEKRSNFEPALWEKSTNTTERSFDQVLEQCWFSGVHSNVGGGYPDEGLADITLSWMIEKAYATGLNFSTTQSAEYIKPNPIGRLYNSRKGIFSLSPSAIRKPDEKSLHTSVMERIRLVKDYKPINLPQNILNVI